LWIARREILRPDQTFFFATTFELEQGQRSSRQPCKRCRTSTRDQENKDIWDLSNIGLDEKIQLFGRRESKLRKGKIEAGHRTSLLHNIFFAHLYSNVSSGLLNYQDSRYTTSSASSSAMERSIEKLSILSLKTSVSAGHSALQNAGRKKKIRLWSTLFSSSTSKMIHVIK
jgi:hypothetical protein